MDDESYQEYIRSVPGLFTLGHTMYFKNIRLLEDSFRFHEKKGAREVGKSS